MPDRGISKDDYVKTIVDILQDHNAHQANTMRVYLILSIDRRNSKEEADEVVDLAIKYRSSGVVGVDLCGNPDKGDVCTFVDAFRRAKSAGLKITLHFAETKGSASDEELQTLLSWQPDRLGHVIHVKDEIRNIIENQNIGLELCLSCNVLAKLIPGSYADHHFGVWRQSTIPVTLCVSASYNCAQRSHLQKQTDDVGIFCSPLSHEYLLAAQHFGLGRNQIRELCERGIDSVFAGSGERSRLCKIYSEWAGWSM